jgi:hypothetical protein
MPIGFAKRRLLKHNGENTGGGGARGEEPHCAAEAIKILTPYQGVKSR